MIDNIKTENIKSDKDAWEDNKFKSIFHNIIVKTE